MEKQEIFSINNYNKDGGIEMFDKDPTIGFCL